MPSVNEWYYLRNGEKAGPMSLADLRELVAKGQVKPQDSVWKAGMAQWVQAQTVPDLFPPPPPPAYPQPPAYAQPPAHAASYTPPAPAKSSTLKWVLIGGVLLIGGCCGIPGIIMMMAGAGHKAQQDEQAKKIAKGADLTVSTDELVAAYKDNKIAADEKYKNKVLEIASTVKGVKDDHIELAAPGHFQYSMVNIYFTSKEKGKAAKLTGGQPLRVRGVCKGMGVFGVYLEQAVIVDD